jgi:hypothetical protein
VIVSCQQLIHHLFLQSSSHSLLPICACFLNLPSRLRVACSRIDSSPLSSSSAPHSTTNDSPLPNFNSPEFLHLRPSPISFTSSSLSSALFSEHAHTLISQRTTPLVSRRLLPAVPALWGVGHPSYDKIRLCDCLLFNHGSVTTQFYKSSTERRLERSWAATQGSRLLSQP